MFNKHKVITLSHTLTKKENTTWYKKQNSIDNEFNRQLQYLKMILTQTDNVTVNTVLQNMLSTEKVHTVTVENKFCTIIFSQIPLLRIYVNLLNTISSLTTQHSSLTPNHTWQKHVAIQYNPGLIGLPLDNDTV